MTYNTILYDYSIGLEEPTNFTSTTCSYFYSYSFTPVLFNLTHDETDPLTLLATFAPPLGTSSIDPYSYRLEIDLGGEDGLEYCNGDNVTELTAN